MTRGVTGTQGPAADPSDPRCFCAGLLESRTRAFRSQTAKHTDTVRRVYTPGGPVFSLFLSLLSHEIHCHVEFQTRNAISVVRARRKRYSFSLAKI